MATFSGHHFWPSSPPPSPSASWWWCVRRPWKLVSQTSETESVAISLLKHLNGDPLDTARTCLGPMLRHKVLVDMVPRPPSHTDGTGALVGTHAKVLLRAGAEGLLRPNNHIPCNCVVDCVSRACRNAQLVLWRPPMYSDSSYETTTNIRPRNNRLHVHVVTKRGNFQPRRTRWGRHVQSEPKE